MNTQVKFLTGILVDLVTLLSVFPYNSVIFNIEKSRAGKPAPTRRSILLGAR